MCSLIRNSTLKNENAYDEMLVKVMLNVKVQGLG